MDQEIVGSTPTVTTHTMNDELTATIDTNTDELTELREEIEATRDAAREAADAMQDAADAFERLSELMGTESNGTGLFDPPNPTPRPLPDIDPSPPSPSPNPNPDPNPYPGPYWDTEPWMSVLDPDGVDRNPKMNVKWPDGSESAGVSSINTLSIADLYRSPEE